MPPRPTGVVQASVSTEDISRKYYETAGYSMWINALHVDPLELIVADDATGKFFQVPVQLSGEEFTFGDPQEVAITYSPVTSKAAAAYPHRWGTRAAALAAAGVKAPEPDPDPSPDPADPDPADAPETPPRPPVQPPPAPTVPPVAPEVSTAGAAIRQMAAKTAVTETPADSGPTESKEALSVDKAKMKEALGLPADATDEQMTEAYAATLSSGSDTPPAPEAPRSSDTVDALAALTGTGQAVLVDRAQLTELVQMAKRGDAAFIENRRNERDSYLEAACREGRFPTASLKAYKKLWDIDPEGTRKQVSLLARNIIPVTAGGLLGDGDDPAAMNEADAAYAEMYGKGK